MITKTKYLNGETPNIIADKIGDYERIGWAVRFIYWHSFGATVVFEKEKVNVK